MYSLTRIFAVGINLIFGKNTHRRVICPPLSDHLHLLFYINTPLPQGKHLGHIISGFKGGAALLVYNASFQYEKRRKC